MSAHLRWTFVTALLVGCATAGPAAVPAAHQGAPPPTRHVTGPMGTTHGATTDAVILSRLESTATEIPPTASVPRIALADVAYPASQDELNRLGGFAVLLVTVVCRNPEELPVDRVETRLGSRVAQLPRVTSRRSELPSGSLSDVFGRFRYDGAYLLPVFATRAHTTVTVYVGGGAFALKVFEFPPPANDDNLPAGLDFDFDVREPQAEALRTLIDRELPVLSGSGL